MALPLQHFSNGGNTVSTNAQGASAPLAATAGGRRAHTSRRSTPPTAALAALRCTPCYIKLRLGHERHSNRAAGVPSPCLAHL